MPEGKPTKLAAPDQVRAMLYKKVDQFVESFEASNDEVDDNSVTINQYAIVAICDYPDPDDPEGEKIEDQVMHFSTRNLFAQVGILRSCLVRIEKAVST